MLDLMQESGVCRPHMAWKQDFNAMVSIELQQLLNGGQGYQRERAPEPLLLPRIATRIEPDSLGFVGHMAAILSRRWAPGGPATASTATCCTLAPLP